ncbi:hypothetical protein M569_04259, partial [Genlisea aurea]
VAAAAVFAVEGLKDLGFCRWNYTMRVIHQHVKSNLAVRSYGAQAQKQLSSATHTDQRRLKKKQQSEEEDLRKIMYLTCWGPN